MSVTTQIVFWILAAASVGGAGTVVFARDVTRMALGLGAFLLSIAGWFLYFSQSFLAVAQVFVYVGGVLVLVLFAIMLVHHAGQDGPELASRHGVDTVMVAVASGFMIWWVLRDVAPALTETALSGGPEQTATVLLGKMLPQFEMAGLLLLAALVAAIVILGGDER